MRKLELGLPVALVAVFSLLAGSLAVKEWNSEFLFYGLVQSVLAVLVLIVHLRVKFPALVMWGLATWAVLHMMGGTVTIPRRLAEPGTINVLYNLRPRPWLPKYDQAVHVYGFFFATLAAWRAMWVASGGYERPTIGVLSLAVFVGMGLGALNEVMEFTATRLFTRTNVGGYDNTGWDLVANLIGCVLAACVVWGRAATGRDARAAL